MQFKNANLTDEQEYVIECVKSGQNTKIQAPAGSGKTFTLEAAADAIKPQQGAYLAFNKAIADSAASKFPPSVECRTGHSFAFRAVGKNYSKRLGKITGKLVADSIDIGQWAPYKTSSKKGYLLLDTIKNFCYSADSEISFYNTPQIIGPFSKQEQFEMKRDLAIHAQILWEKMINPNETIPITHDVYLKLWQLSKPKLHKHFILFDEAQDANAVMLDIVKNQNHSQRIYVGDKYQQIYAWRGAVNAMDLISTVNSPFLTQSFRFGSEIADLASDILINYTLEENPPLRIRGFKERDSRVVTEPIENPDVIICRTNQGVISNVFDCLEKKKRVYVQGGVSNIVSLVLALEDVRMGKGTFHPDLFLFSNYSEILEYSNSESGGDLRPLLTMIEKHGTRKLVTALQATCQNAYEAEITITTAHKSKGLEWGKVQLHNDFAKDDEDEGEKAKVYTQADINLLYVASTRALDILDISYCPPCKKENLVKGRENVIRYKKEQQEMEEKENEEPINEEEKEAVKKVFRRKIQRLTKVEI